MHGRSLVGRSCACALALLFLLSGNAHALEAERVGTVLKITAERGERSFLTVSQSGTTIRVQNSGPYDRPYDPSELIYPYAGAGCTSVPVPATEWSVAYSYATCSSVGLTRVEIVLGAEMYSRVHAFEGPISSPTEPLLVPAKITAPDYAHVYGTPAAPNELIATRGAVLVGGNQADVIRGGPLHDELAGNGGDDDVKGGAGADTLYDGDGTDTLDGGDGEDTLVATLGGADRVDGGGDRDDCRFTGFNENTPAGVAISLDGVANDGPRSGPRTANVYGCERVEGTRGPDLLTGSAGDDDLNAGGCCDASSTLRDELRGLGGNDALNVESGSALLDGGSGDDRMEAGWGDQEVRGGPGLDWVGFGGFVYDPVVADLDGQRGDDGRPALGERDTLGTDIENLRGGEDDDVLGGNAADNVLDGRGGADELDGAGGADTAVLTEYRSVAVDLDGETGVGASRNDGTPQDLGLESIEHVDGTSGDDLLIGNAARNTLNGFYGNDLLEGAGGADELRGGDGLDAASYADRMAPVTIDLRSASGGQAREQDALLSIEDVLGGAGADTMFGDSGENLLSGGAGADVIDGRAGEDAIYGDAGADVIEARDGEEDLIDCGDDGALLAADLLDITENCPTTSAPPAAGPVPPVASVRPGPSPVPVPALPPVSPPISAAAALSVSHRFPLTIRRSALRRPGLQVRVRCDARCTMSAVMRVRAGARPIARASLTSSGKRWATLTLRRRSLAKGLRSVRVELTVTDARGRKQRWTRLVSLE